MIWLGLGQKSPGQKNPLGQKPPNNKKYKYKLFILFNGIFAHILNDCTAIYGLT